MDQQKLVDRLTDVAGLAVDAIGQGVGAVHRASQCRDFDKLYETKGDFQRAPEFRRLVVIGCTGAGKSTLLNVMGGWQFVQDQSDFNWSWKDKGDQPPLFQSPTTASESVTQSTAFANLNWFGNDARPFIAVDTPGHDDTGLTDIEDNKAAQEKEIKLATDLHIKLRALGHIHCILVLHGDVTGNRLNPAIHRVLRMIDDKFKEAGSDVWKNVVIAYSRCNEHTRASWAGNLDVRKAAIVKAIQKEIEGCTVDLPVLALGGGEPEGKESSSSADFEVLHSFLMAAEPIDTTRLAPEKGIGAVIRDAVERMHEAEALVKASRMYLIVMLQLMLVLLVLLLRALVVPNFLAPLVLDFEGLTDEVLLLLLASHVIGPANLLYSSKYAYQVWLEPTLGPYLPGKKERRLKQD